MLSLWLTMAQAHPGMPQMQDPRAELLAQMNDVVAPSEIGLWPPAPGWWLLFGSLIIATVILAKYLRKKALAGRYKKVALQELQQLSHQEADKAQYYKSVMHILKRTFFTAYPGSRNVVAGLHGSQWLSMLQKTAKSHLAIESLCDTIDTELYGEPSSDKRFMNELMMLAKYWVQYHKPMSTHVWSDIISDNQSEEARHV